jgi:hypothetical protein
MAFKPSVLLVAGIVAGLAISQAAQAKRVQLEGHYSQSQVKAACAKAGGTDYADGGVYGCEHEGNGTSVYCNSKECWGYTPDRIVTGNSGNQASQVVKDPLAAVLRGQ